MTETEIENRELKRQLAAMRARLDAAARPRSAAELSDLERAQSRADGVLGLMGEQAPAPQHGESPLRYRRRLAAIVAGHSESFKGARFDSLDAGTLRGVEDRIYAEAEHAARDPANVPAGTMRRIQERDAAGRLVTKWIGDEPLWMNAFAQTGARGFFKRPQ